jgi:hypothetical protein
MSRRESIKADITAFWITSLVGCYAFWFVLIPKAWGFVARLW